MGSITTQRFIIDVTQTDKHVEMKIGSFEHDFPVLQLIHDRLCTNINSVLGIDESKIHTRLNEQDHSLTIIVDW